MGQDFRISDLRDIKVHSVSLGEGIKGFLYVSKRGVPHVFVNDTLSQEKIAETVAHELYHLQHDKLSHGIGLDRQHEPSEHRANTFARHNAHLLLGFMTT